VEADLVVTGHAHIGEGARVIGSIKAHRGLTLGARVEVTGSVVCRSDVAIGRGCSIGGPLISETTLTLAAGCVIGSIERPTTVSASAIVVDPGAAAHGTVWAHAMGEVRVHAANGRAGNARAGTRGAAA
jgi:cytoskeletal protein CcmA (bactofilin family)